MHEPAGKRPGTQDLRQSAPLVGAPSAGKQTLVEQAYDGSVQRLATGEAAHDPSAVHAAAASGVATAASPLPHMDAIQRSFGRHDISGIQAHTGADAAASAGAMGARAYATGDHVVLGGGTDLHTVAHEAAHVVQQRAGVHLAGGVGAAGDPYEQHADAVADLVVQGKSAEALLDTHAPKGGGGSAPRGAVQHKLEFASHYKVAPDVATNAVKADQAAYEAEAEQFEHKLGIGLFKHRLAQDGANAMLGLMQQAMTRAGIDDAGQRAAFGSKASTSPDLGAVLSKDVRAALDSGNLREKMGMVYQARSKISEALDTLRQDDAAQELIGDELKTPEMGTAIDAQKADPKGHVSYAILARRNSVKTQPRTLKPRAQIKAELTEQQLQSDGIGLSDREQEAATPENGQRAFVPGRQVYAVAPDARKNEQDNLRRVAAGLSGSADMYFHIAKHLKMPEAQRPLLRLAALGQMLSNRDHSYHEIMHEAKTQGGLTDYDDLLPIGYTQLAPLKHDDILKTAGNAAGFPGDAQIKALSAPMKSADAIASEAPHGASSKRYPAVLEVLRAYENNPNRAQLQPVIERISAWLTEAEPKVIGKDKYNQRAVLLREVLKKARYLASMAAALDAHGAERVSTVEDALTLAPDNDSKRFMNSIADLDEEHGDWYAPTFRATAADMALDTTAIAIPADKDKLGNEEALNRNLKKDTTSSVGESRWELEALNGGDGRDVPDIQDLGLHPRLRNNKKTDTQSTILENQELKKNPEDFAEIDGTTLQALEPTAPLGGALKRFEGHAVPQELHALNAYTQAGFFDMMNLVLNRRANKAFMASPAGKKWWNEEVPAQAKQLISLAISGIRKMKPFTGGTLYRGENLVHGVSPVLTQSKGKREAHWQSKVPTTKRYNQFVSTSKQPYSSYLVREGKFTAGHFTSTKSGVDVSALGGKLKEREVVFAPGTSFKVTRVEDRFYTAQSGESPDDRYGSRADEAKLEKADEQGRIKVTFEEE